MSVHRGGLWARLARNLAVALSVSLFAVTGARADEREAVLSPEAVLESMRRVADWQLDHLGGEARRAGGRPQKVSPSSWMRGALFAGVMAMSRASADERYVEVVREHGEGNDWRPGPRRRHADDLCIAQSYAELFLIEREPEMIEAVVARLDDWVAEAERARVGGRRQRERRVWSDALFMAPPTFALLSKATGDRRYLEAMHDDWWQAWAELYDPQEHLWYRDAEYVIGPDGAGPRTSNGRKIFWSRGNGWVLAGLARVLEHLPPDDDQRPRYESLMREMASSLIELQGDDGLWRASLRDPGAFPGPETSGTSLIAFGLAWGVNNGVLKRKTFWPPVLAAWGGLSRAVAPSGRLGWVQLIDREPRAARESDTGEFASGAFLLAGEEVLAGLGVAPTSDARD